MSERLRVVEIIHDFAIEAEGGGIGRFTFALSQAMDPNRFQVSVCGLFDLGGPYEAKWMYLLRQNGVDALTAATWDARNPYLSFWRACQGLRAALRHEPAHLLHSHSEFGDMAALFLRLTMSKPPLILRTLHNGFRYEWRKRPLRRFLLSNLLYPLLFDGEIGVSRHVVANLDQRWLSKMRKRGAYCIYNAIDFSRFSQVEINQSALREALGIPINAFIIGSVGRLTFEKGYQVFLEAATQVATELPEAWFLLVGAGEQETALKQAADSLRILNRVVFTGPRSDVEALLAVMDLFVSSSLWEGLSTAVLEAMAAGVPVVATNIPGNQELIQDNQNGWLAIANDASALAQTILLAAKNPESRQQYAARARQAAKNFSIEAVALEHADLYTALSAVNRK